MAYYEVMSKVCIENENRNSTLPTSWATKKKFHFWDGKSAISSYILNEFGGKFKEKYWKLGQIGQNIQKLVKVDIFSKFLQKQ